MRLSPAELCSAYVSTNARRGLLDAFLGPPWARTPTGQAAAPVPRTVPSPTFDVLPGALRLHLLFGLSSWTTSVG